LIRFNFKQLHPAHFCPSRVQQEVGSPTPFSRILIHSVDDPTPGWDGGSRGIAKRSATRKAVLGCLAE